MATFRGMKSHNLGSEWLQIQELKTTLEKSKAMNTGVNNHKVRSYGHEKRSLKATNRGVKKSHKLRSEKPQLEGFN